MTPLPPQFYPSDNDVLVGRGKTCFNHVGNQRFRLLVNSHLDRYANTKSKLEKSSILKRVVDEVRSRSPSGGFVKKDLKTNRWYEVGDFLAREKTSQCFRDALHERYRSSTKSKKQRRQVELAKASDRLHSIANLSDTNISSHIMELTTAVERGGTESDMTDLFTRTNMEILKSLNRFSGNNNDETAMGGEQTFSVGTAISSSSTAGIDLLVASSMQQQQQQFESTQLGESEQQQYEEEEYATQERNDSHRNYFM